MLEAKYEAKLEFPGGTGRGVQNKKPSAGGVILRNFLELHNHWITCATVRILVATFIMFNQNLRQASSCMEEQ